MKPTSAVEDLRLTFPGTGKLLFKDLSVTIQDGEKVLILGPSGSGKSTLLQVLTGLIPHTIQLPLKYQELIQPDSWGYVFQDPDSQFCMPYVDEEIAFVLENLGVNRQDMNELINQYLSMVGLEFDENHIRISQLSQGMKQRLAIASVLALQPSMLVFDEPTALLDPEGTKQIWETIQQIGENKTVVIVEHKIDYVIDFVDRVIVLDAYGQILADGNPQQVFKQHKKQLSEFGVWHPGVWQEYVASRKEPDGDPLLSENPIIELRNFNTKRGKQTVNVVEQADIQPGEWICVTGKNGAGKSSFFLGLMNVLKTEGRYLLNNRQVERKEIVSDQIGFVFQNPEHQFITNDVFSEIAFTLKQDGLDDEAINKTVHACLEAFSLSDHKDKHPYQLSIGQKRRLSVATAIVKNQQVLILDEPTFGQDAKNTFALLEMLEGCRKRGISILMVTHDLNIVNYFSTRLWIVEDGRVVEHKLSENEKKVVH